ncbi:MAG: hypothetical protein WC315_00690 [Candidatus Omnitrophota bacterium]|jgi:hypothetical protein
MKYRVYVPVTGYNVYTVDANSPEDAVETVASGDCDPDGDTALTEEDVDTGLWDVEPDNN